MAPKINDLEGLSAEQLRALVAQYQAKDGAPGRRKRRGAAVQYLTHEELAALLRAIKLPRDQAIFELAYHRGLRASEVGRLQFSHLRLDAKRIYVPRLKGGYSGEYLLTEREMRTLRAWLRIRGREPGPLFLSRHKRAIGRRRLDQLMKAYGQAAGLPEEKRHFHCLRHSCATHLMEMADVAEVQDHLGHRDVRNTVIYAKVTNKKRTELGERLSGKW